MKCIKKALRKINNKLNPYKKNRDAKDRGLRQAIEARIDFENKAKAQLNQEVQALRNEINDAKNKIQVELKTAIAEKALILQKELKDIELFDAALDECMGRIAGTKALQELVRCLQDREQELIDMFLLCNPLGIAMLFGAKTAVEFLFENFGKLIDPDAQGVFSFTAAQCLECVYSADYAHKIKQLQQWQAVAARNFSNFKLYKALNAKNARLDDELLSAVFNGQFARVKELINLGANVNAVEIVGGVNALQLAILAMHREIAEYLAAQPGVIFSYTPNSNTLPALPLARHYTLHHPEYQSVVNIINAHPIHHKLLNAAAEGNLNEVKDAILEGADVNTVTKEGYSPLQLPLLFQVVNARELVNTLLYFKAEQSYKAINGLGMHAAQDLAVARTKPHPQHFRLAEMAVIVDDFAQGGRACLSLEQMLAMSRDDLINNDLSYELLCKLIRYGLSWILKDVVAKGVYDQRAYEFAQTHGCEEAKQILGYAKFLDTADILSKFTTFDLNTGLNPLGDTPLIYATKLNQLEMVQCMLDLGADIYRANIHQQTVLEVAVQANNLDMIKLFIRAGAVISNDLLNLAKGNHPDVYEHLLFSHKVCNYLMTQGFKDNLYSAQAIEFADKHQAIEVIGWVLNNAKDLKDPIMMQ